MDRLLQDVRFALRLLWKDRGFTATTVATLALCIAANTAIFAVVNSVLLRPLPFANADRFVTMDNRYPGAGVEIGSNGVPDYYDRLAQTTVFEEIALYRSTGVTIGGQGSEAERITSVPATPSFFRLLGAQPHRGQTFTEQETDVDHARKVILSFGLWQRLYGGRDDAIGGELRLNGVPYTIMGVMPARFRFLDPEVQLWTPAAFAPADRSDDRRHSNNWQMMARLKPGATIEQAQSQIDAINAANLDRFPGLKKILIDARFHTKVRDFQSSLVENTQRTLYLLWGGVIVVLVIGCLNIANLVSVRSTSRVRELATRHALGASLHRLSRQIVTETLLLSIVGGGLGMALGYWALSAAAVVGFDQLPRGYEIALDATSVLFTFGLVLGVGLFVGLVPVLSLGRTNLALIVREEGRSGTATRSATMIRRLLVASQVAFALVLLAGAGLLVASFQRVLAVDPGFEADHLLTGNISLPRSRYPNEAAGDALVGRLLEGLRALPGVVSAGFTTSLPMGGSYSDSVIIAEGYQFAPGESLISPSQIRVTPGYFEAMRIEVRRGRAFDARDHRKAARAIIVDERLAQKFWSNQDPIGKRLYFPNSAQNLLAAPPQEDFMTVVGVAADVVLSGLVDGAGVRRVGAYYLPVEQSSNANFTLAVRTTQDPRGVTPAIRKELAAIDPELPFYGVRTMEERVRRSLIDRRTPMILASSFSLVALFLAAIGLYGVLAYQVSQRRREIGIRMALGAKASSIFRMVLREGARMIGAGALLGFIGAVLLRQTLQSQLYEIGALDPRVMGSVAGVLIVVGVIACLVPARKAAHTDPVIALTDQG
jgi:predicted permease